MMWNVVVSPASKFVGRSLLTATPHSCGLTESEIMREVYKRLENGVKISKDNVRRALREIGFSVDGEHWFPSNGNRQHEFLFPSATT